MNNTNYTICKPNQAQRERALKHFDIKTKQERESAVIYTAVDESGEVLGRVIAIKRDIPSSIKGQYWLIKSLFVEPEYRRKGIATALVNEVKLQAKASGAVYLYGSAKASFEASMFWLKQGVTLNAYGKKQEDPSKPLLLGNYFHMFSYRLERKELSADSRSVSVRALLKDEIPHLINKYAPTESKRSYLLGKSDELFGFAAVGTDGEPLGIILALSDSMKAPLDSTQWGIFLFVEPQYRNRGIGRALVRKMYQCARENEDNVLQLTNIGSEDYIGFWYELGFDIFLWGVNEQTRKRAATAMIRVK